MVITNFCGHNERYAIEVVCIFTELAITNFSCEKEKYITQTVYVYRVGKNKDKNICTQGIRLFLKQHKGTLFCELFLHCCFIQQRLVGRRRQRWRGSRLGGFPQFNKDLLYVTCVRLNCEHLYMGKLPGITSYLGL